MSFTFQPDLEVAAQLRQELARIRRAADANYFGADIRMDFGDPTLGAVENARGRSFFAGLAAWSPLLRKRSVEYRRPRASRPSPRKA